MESTQTHNTKIGKDLLQILMFNMYPDSRTIYREYIQNACDSINEAIKLGIISNKEGHIDIQINDITRTVVITDNGTGIASYDFAPRVKDIANSSKDGISTIGFYGIGRLVGAGYCNQLIFRTSFMGEPIISEIVFNVDEASKILNDREDTSSAGEVIDAVSKISYQESEKESHFFEVTLLEIKRDYPDLINQKEICEYLKQIAPIDYTMPFKSQLIIPSFEGEYKHLYESVSSYRISINDIIDIRKTYDLKIEVVGDEIECFEPFKIEVGEFGLLAWGWYAITPFTKMLTSNVKNRNIRLRKHNIQLGEAGILNKYFPETRGNNYFIGEIHIVHPNIHPDSSRSGMTPSPEAEVFKLELERHFEYLNKLYRLANSSAKALEKFAVSKKRIG